MPVVKLQEAWIYAGVRYGPGEAEMPNDVAKALSEKGAIVGEKKKAAPKLPEPDQESDKE